MSFWTFLTVRYTRTDSALQPVFESVNFHVTDDGRNYIFVRFETGDEMSRRKKFALITWIGSAVSPLKKAKVSTDKAFVKEIITVSF